MVYLDPVVTPAGVTCSRAALRDHFSVHFSDPGDKNELLQSTTTVVVFMAKCKTNVHS